MTRQERRKRRRQRRRMQAALLASLLFTLVLIVTLRIRETAPEPVAERTSALAAERQTLTYIAPARPEAAEETPEELTVEPEPENRYAELHFSDEDVYILACLVYHEARGESFEGQVAVVEVVLNRMLSDYFPDTVEEAFEPRFLSEEIDGERHEYADTLWIPSATDVFGAGDWWNEEPDSVQLEIFKRERDRVKEHIGDGTWYWWLRSPLASNSVYFVFVDTGGTVYASDAYYSLGFAPGFDL